jgi:hypothetical protein
MHGAWPRRRRSAGVITGYSGSDGSVKQWRLNSASVSRRQSVHSRFWANRRQCDAPGMALTKGRNTHPGGTDSAWVVLLSMLTAQQATLGTNETC